MPKSAATTAIQPTVEPSENTPNPWDDSRRAATIVTRNSEALPAASATVLYATSPVRDFGFGNDFSSAVSSVDMGVWEFTRELPHMQQACLARAGPHARGKDLGHPADTD